MDENNLESPILSWQDPRPHNTPLDTLGLTALGSGVFFKYSCSLQSELPGSACTSDGDCSYLANTVCRLKTESTSAAAVKVKVCQCMEGFQPIPGMLSAEELFGEVEW